MRWLLPLSLCALLPSPPLHADGLIHRLPEDGTSAMFTMEFVMKKGGEEEKIGGSMVMSSVGATEEDGKKCRWIEFKLQMERKGKTVTIIAKTLIPEKSLKAGENPGAAMIRGWIQDPENQNPKELKSLQNERAGPLPVFLSGPLQQAKKLTKKSLDNKALGKIDSEGEKGENTFDLNPEKLAVKMENRLHAKAPFGVVESKMEVQAFRNDQLRNEGTLTLKLIEVSKNAKSELPDNK